MLVSTHFLYKVVAPKRSQFPLKIFFLFKFFNQHTQHNGSSLSLSLTLYLPLSLYVAKLCQWRRGLTSKRGTDRELLLPRARPSRRYIFLRLFSRLFFINFPGKRKDIRKTEFFFSSSHISFSFLFWFQKGVFVIPFG